MAIDTFNLQIPQVYGKRKKFPEDDSKIIAHTSVDAKQYGPDDGENPEERGRFYPAGTLRLNPLHKDAGCVEKLREQTNTQYKSVHGYGKADREGVCELSGALCFHQFV